VAKVWLDGPEIVECARFILSASVFACLLVNILEGANELAIVPALLLETIEAYWPVGLVRVGGVTITFGPRIRAVVVGADVSIGICRRIAAILIGDPIFIAIQIGSIFGIGSKRG
jgi:hypothetical protein